MADQNEEVQKNQEAENANEQQLDDKDLEKAAGGSFSNTRNHG